MPWRDTESGTLWIPQSCSAPLLMVTYTDQYWNSIDVSTATTHEYNVGALSFDTSVDLRGTFDIATSYLGLLGETQVLVDMSLVGRGFETPMSMVSREIHDVSNRPTTWRMLVFQEKIDLYPTLIHRQALEA